jgi:hypothetical protein
MMTGSEVDLAAAPSNVRVKRLKRSKIGLMIEEEEGGGNKIFSDK